MIIEFATEEEARFAGFTNIQYSSTGCYVEVIEKPVTGITDNRASSNRFVVCTNYEGSMMYVGDKNQTTFNKSVAKIFSKRNAMNKAYYMSLRGNYEWKAIPI